MATNTTDFRGDGRLAEEALRVQRSNHELRDVDAALAVRAETTEAGQELVLAPLVDQVAHGFAKVLVIAMKELEIHIANENRKLGDSVGERLAALQASFQGLADFVSEQRALSRSVQEKCERLEATAVALEATDVRQQTEIVALRTETKELTTSISEKMDAATAALRECDARQDAELAALRSEAKEASASVSVRIDELYKEIAVQQDDLVAIKSTLSGFNSRVDSVVERLDRQAEAVHSMYSTYSQRESELEQLVEGLTRLRSVPVATPANRL